MYLTGMKRESDPHEGGPLVCRRQVAGGEVHQEPKVDGGTVPKVHEIGASEREPVRVVPALIAVIVPDVQFECMAKLPLPLRGRTSLALSASCGPFASIKDNYSTSNSIPWGNLYPIDPTPLSNTAKSSATRPKTWSLMCRFGD